MSTSTEGQGPQTIGAIQEPEPQPVPRHEIPSASPRGADDRLCSTERGGAGRRFPSRYDVAELIKRRNLKLPSFGSFGSTSSCISPSCGSRCRQPALTSSKRSTAEAAPRGTRAVHSKPLHHARVIGRSVWASTSSGNHAFHPAHSRGSCRGRAVTRFGNRQPFSSAVKV